MNKSDEFGFYGMQIDNFLKKLSSSEPIPGGGSAGCLVMCIGLSLLKKCAVVSKKRYEKNGDTEKIRQIDEIVADIDEFADFFKWGMDEDARVFLECVSKKDVSFDERFYEARKISQEFLSKANLSLEVGRRLLEICSPYIVLDCRAGCYMIETAMEVFRGNAEYC